MRLIRGSIGAGEAALDLAVAHQMLRDAGADPAASLTRLYRPRTSMVVFGRRDTRQPGFPLAVAAARDAGFTPAVRVTGGRAVAYTPQTLVVDFVQHQPSAMHDHTARFDRFGTLFVDAFRGLGIDASIGAVPGEYCPGAHSVNARHQIKLVGTAQRVIRDAWLFSALIVVDDSELLKPVLREVYECLEQPFDPASVGSLAEEARGLTVPDAERAVLDALGAPGADEPAGLEALASRARALLHHHQV